MGNAILNFLDEVWLTLIAVWLRANDEIENNAMPVIRGFIVALAALPVAAIAFFIIGFSAAIPMLGIFSLILLVWFLFWRFEYPAVYAALLLERGQKIAVDIIFAISVECFLGIVLAAFGMMVRGQGLGELSLTSIIAFGIITAILLSVGVTTDRERVLRRMIKWTVGIVVLAAVLLAFPPVREKLPRSKTAIGQWTASLMPDTGTVSPVSSLSGTPNLGSVERVNVGESAGVGGTTTYSDEPVSPAGPLDGVAEASDRDTVTTEVMVSWRENTRLRVVTTDSIVVINEQFGGIVPVVLPKGESYWYARDKAVATGPDQYFRFTRASAETGSVKVWLQVASNDTR